MRRASQLLLLLAVVTCCMLLLPAVVEGVRDKKFYDILGVPEDADDRIIKKAYKKQAL